MLDKRVEITRSFSSWDAYISYKKSREWKAKGYKECGVSMQTNSEGESIIVGKYYKMVKEVK